MSKDVKYAYDMMSSIRSHKEMQIKTTRRCHCISSTMFTISKILNILRADGEGMKEREHSFIVWGIKSDTPFGKEFVN